MKIIDELFPNNYKEVALHNLTIEYTQDLDCCQSEKDYSDGYQSLTLTTDDGGSGKFIRIITGIAGWSIDDIDDLVDIIKDFKQRLKCE